jgi:membrane protein implicated in regulation of membrane protease activity
MALVRYTALRFLVFAVVAALLWIFGLRDFWLLLVAILLSGFVSLFVLNRSRDELSSAYLERREKIKKRMAERAAAEDAWNDRVRGASGDAESETGN